MGEKYGLKTGVSLGKFAAFLYQFPDISIGDRAVGNNGEPMFFISREEGKNLIHRTGKPVPRLDFLFYKGKLARFGKMLLVRFEGLKRWRLHLAPVF